MDKIIRQGVPLILLLCCLLAACGSHPDAFYQDSTSGDLIRMPLIRPYQLLTLSNIPADTTDPRYVKSWVLRFKLTDDHINVTNINVEKGLIYGHGQEVIHAPNDWFVIIPAEKIEKTFTSEKEWKIFLGAKGIDPTPLYRPWEIFPEFRNNSRLPWYDPSHPPAWAVPPA